MLTERALESYRTIDAVARVDAALPGALVATLFAELSDCLDSLSGAIALDQAARRNRVRARIDAILLSLESSLNPDAGDLATRLGTIYRSVRRMVALAVAENDPDRCKQAQVLIAPIAEAWVHIAQTA